MNTNQNYSHPLKSDFSTVLSTVQSYDFFEDAIKLCDELNTKYDLTDKERSAVNQHMTSFHSIYQTKDDSQHPFRRIFSGEEKKTYSRNYAYLFDLRECSRLLELPLIERLPDEIHQLPYTSSDNSQKFGKNNTGNVIQFPNRGSQHPETPINNPQITPIHSQDRVAPHIRKQAILNSAFGPNGELLPEKVIKENQERIAKILSSDPISANLYKWDCLAANDEKFPDTELSDEMIIRAIETAKTRKDGAFIQSIKNNLTHRAQELEKNSKSGIEKSLLLADHVKNLSPKNPITMHTVEFGICQIINMQTIEHGDEAHYNIELILKNGAKKYINVLSSSCVVGDLSNHIIIRSIQSTIPPDPLEKSGTITLKDHTTNFFKKGLSGIKNMFGFRKNI